MTTSNNTGFQTFQATAVAIAAAVRVKLDANGLISVAGATDAWIGVTTDAIAVSGYGMVKLRNAPGTLLVTASNAIARGARLYPTAAGKVDDAAGTGNFTGLQAMTAATADGDIIEAVPSDIVAFRANAAQAAQAAYGDGVHGLDTAAHMEALYNKVEDIGTALVAAGIIKGSA
jgi:hypothetical protein